jgi:hypothetical protein
MNNRLVQNVANYCDLAGSYCDLQQFDIIGEAALLQ